MLDWCLLEGFDDGVTGKSFSEGDSLYIKRWPFVALHLHISVYPGVKIER